MQLILRIVTAVSLAEWIVVLCPATGASWVLRARSLLRVSLKIIGIVQKVFSEKASAIARMRQKCVKNASEMRQNGSCFIGKRGTSKMRQKSVKIASKKRQKSAEHLWGRTPFGRYRNEGVLFSGYTPQETLGVSCPRDSCGWAGSWQCERSFLRLPDLLADSGRWMFASMSCGKTTHNINSLLQKTWPGQEIALLVGLFKSDPKDLF